MSTRESYIQSVASRMADDGETTVGDCELIKRFSMLLNLSPSIRAAMRRSVEMGEELSQRPDANGANERLPTGVVATNGDWPGLFIRGDDAIAFVSALTCVLECMDRDVNAPLYVVGSVIRLSELLQSCHWENELKPLLIRRDRHGQEEAE